jgi:hypothetical protein
LQVFLSRVSSVWQVTQELGLLAVLDEETNRKEGTSSKTNRIVNLAFIGPH